MNQREIKFRAWDKIRNLMITSKHWSVGFGGEIRPQGREEYNHNEFILMQFTGLKDKNGKEIYENDYLEIPEVSDNSKTWCVFWGSGKYILQNISTGDILDCNETNTRNKTIIGNTFESPREHKAMASDL